jgi:hypothetical protein
MPLKSRIWRVEEEERERTMKADRPESVIGAGESLGPGGSRNHRAWQARIHLPRKPGWESRIEPRLTLAGHDVRAEKTSVTSTVELLEPKTGFSRAARSPLLSTCTRMARLVSLTCIVKCLSLDLSMVVFQVSGQMNFFQDGDKGQDPQFAELL